MTENIYEIIEYMINIWVAIPFALQSFAYIICLSYKRAALDVHNTNKEIFRSIKLRYTNQAKLEIPLEDSRSYVHKYLLGQGGPLRMPSTISSLSSFFYCVALLSTVALFLREQLPLTRMIAVLAASFCFFIFKSAFSVDRLIMLTVEFTVDYLDNTLKHRLAPAKRKERATQQIPMPANKEPKQPAMESSTAPAIKFAFDGPNSEIIESVLQEFLA